MGSKAVFFKIPLRPAQKRLTTNQMNNAKDPEKQAGHGDLDQQAEGATPSVPDAGLSDPSVSLFQERDALKERLLRVAAEFENYKKRVARDIDDTRFQAQDRLLREFLPVMDNLDRAIQTAESTQGASIGQPVLEGIRLVQKQFLAALEKFDIRPIEALGQPFDPAFHEAIQHASSDQFPPGTVCLVWQRGFMAGQRVLRAALVSVVQGVSAPSGTA